MNFIYYTLTFENYGFALILFTVLTRLAMLPLTIKQYQGTAKMQKLQPRLDELRRQFGTDKKRLQEETVKLYQDEKVNPAGGCLPLLIQFPILFSLYPVITQPLRYMLGKTQEQITALQELYVSITGSASRFIQQMEMLTFFKNDTASMARAEAANLLFPGDLINMSFFGLDLSRVPTYSPDVLFGEQMPIYLPLLLIPLIGVASTYISGKISMASSAAQSAQNQQSSSMNKSMQVIGPVMTLVFSFQLPAGVLVYWIAGYLIQIVQQLFINKYVLKLDNIFTGKREGADDNTGRLADKNRQVSENGVKSITGGFTAGAVSAIGTTGAAGAEPENLYDGGAMINRVISSLGGTGGIGAGMVKSAGTEGLVHGGVFESNVRIPGITNTGVDGTEDGGESSGAVAGESAGEEGAGAGAGSGAGERIDAGTSVLDANGGLKPAAASADNHAASQRSQGVDTRSSTRKNYGSQKRKKKK